MNQLLYFIGVTLGGSAGWWAGEYFDLDLSMTFLISSLGSLIGVYLAWRIIRDFLG